MALYKFRIIIIIIITPPDTISQQPCAIIMCT